MPPGRRRQPGMVLDEHPAIRPGRERHIHRSWSQPGPAAAGAGTPEGWFPDGPAGSVLVGRTAGRKRVPACGGDGNAVAVNRESRGDADVMDGGQHGGRNLRAERAGSVGSHHCSSPRHACAPTRVRRLWNWRAYMMKCRGSPTSTSNAPMNGRGRLLPRVRATRRVRPPGPAADESPRSHPGTPGTGTRARIEGVAGGQLEVRPQHQGAAGLHNGHRHQFWPVGSEFRRLPSARLCHLGTMRSALGSPRWLSMSQL